MKKITLLILVSFLFVSCSNKQNVWDDDNDISYKQSSRSTTTRSTISLPGMFGIKFGQKISTLKVSKGVDANTYLVDPPKPVGYDLYLVKINPNSREVETISAGSPFRDKIDCQSHQVRYVESMIEEFGKSSLVRNKDNSVSFFLYNTLITASCSDKGVFTVIHSALNL